MGLKKTTLPVVVAHVETRHPMCDCGACCDQCGHDRGCMSREENQR